MDDDLRKQRGMAAFKMGNRNADDFLVLLVLLAGAESNDIDSPCSTSELATRPTVVSSTEEPPDDASLQRITAATEAAGLGEEQEEQQREVP